MSQTQSAPAFSPITDLASLETPRAPNGSLSITALARFEFEAGKGNEGTKILMVEWENDDLTRSPSGSWHVSWEGKTTVLPADEQTSEHTRRFYFLLPPGVTIPPVITLTYEPPPNSATTAKKNDSLQLNPLPAIFPAELGATARTAGKKGVLHTIWAKKRLQVLEKEIREECLNNAEGVALHMAIQEKEWIESNFGVTARPQAESLNTSLSVSTTSYPMGPTTPVSPTSGRKLADKLKGLKLETSEKDLAKRAAAGAMDTPNSVDDGAHLLSPQSPDVAVSSYNSFRNTPVSEPPRKAVVHHPPASVQAQQNSAQNLFGSMDTIARTSSADSDNELFAKALSPRSPDIPRSPFSFAPEETLRYVAPKGV
ncbi:hypothetical protein DTO021D3_7762 [Paecilomyces variotii]|nr:hypothetical protein DTO032I3_3972 [Paecilomyces variotii]KAJ9275344.1 hypothetical protein DTO021D3_7762 [Paecilomyces variotii]KAJ9339508.1 hypothetical protein DTO027B6_7971 [Paecilomyces variotii]KAJ9380002.1 hypothetical protein DTO032I4_6966 [Paecilomyces variotii]